MECIFDPILQLDSNLKGEVVLSCKVFFGFSDNPTDECDLEPFIGDNSTPSPRKRSPTAEFLADNSTPSPRKRSPTAEFLADNSTPSPRKRSPTAEFLADISTPSPRKQSPTAEFRERVDYLEDDRQQYESALVGEFKI
jgi:hypothetical protein